MEPILLGRWLLVGLGILGHVTLFIAAFNRVNAVGWNRKTIKLCEKGIVLACFLLPALMVALASIDWKSYFLESNSIQESVSFRVLQAYLGLASVALAWMAPGWLFSRWHLIPSKKVLRSTATDHWNLAKNAALAVTTPYRSPSFRLAGSLPGNQIGQLQRSEKTLRIPGLSASWNGFKIGHLSDLHLTGGMSDAYYQFAFERCMELSPDIILVSGDLVDFDRELKAMERLAGLLHAPLGCYFVLGNHDRRLSRPESLREILAAHAWVDLSQQAVQCRCDRGPIFMMGNELPWFGPAVQRWCPEGSDVPWSPDAFRISVAHSPDQFPWAVQSQSHLLLCGHTHGGQVQLPLLGPLIAPSWQGSRFASGVFRRKDTIMHVSRGLSGVHPIRWRCLPEITSITLET